MNIARLAVDISTFLVGASLLALCGCVNTGSRVVVGEQYALPEVSDAADNFSAKIYEDITGASVWTRKDSEVHVVYRCAYTNSYCGVVHTQSDMSLDVTVTPLAVSSDDSEEAK